jgi:hypothetical protein
LIVELKIDVAVAQFQGFPKVLTDRITSIAGNLISENQTTFIKNRNILEGVVVLHEVIHEFRRT